MGDEGKIVSLSDRLLRLRGKASEEDLFTAQMSRTGEGFRIVIAAIPFRELTPQEVAGALRIIADGLSEFDGWPQSNDG